MKVVSALIVLMMTAGSSVFASESLSSVSKRSEELNKKYKKCGYCEQKKAEVDKYNEEHLFPALEKAGEGILNKRNAKTAQLIIKVVLQNQKSTAENFSSALGDVYISDPKKFLQLVNAHNEADRRFLFATADQGIQNHTSLSKQEMYQLLKDLKDAQQLSAKNANLSW